MANLKLLDNANLRLILLGGKGGVGKTTSAAAASIYLARLWPGKKVLLVSIDPAHSLGDSFERNVGGEITRVDELENLWLLEMDAHKLLDEFKNKYEVVMKELAERGTYFDREDIEEFFSLALPGLDEVMAVIEVARLLKSGGFDLIVLDTAPTGHTLRLLALPAQMKKWVAVFDLMQEKHRLLQRRFGGRHVKDEADEFLGIMADGLDRVDSLLKDGTMTEFVPVTIPEPAAIEETGRLLASLKDYGIPVRSMVVNRVIGETDCPFCSSRKTEIDRCLQEIEGRFSGYRLMCVPLFSHDIHGLESLSEFAEFLFKQRKLPGPAGKEIAAPPHLHPYPLSLLRNIVADLSGKAGLEFLLFGGKGGVGKTTMAASTALCMARENPGRKILILSTDPAHSLSDCFGHSIGNVITPIIETAAGGHLHALEMDAPHMLEEFRNKYCADIEEVFTPFIAGGGDIVFDREVMLGLVDLSPPGLDEIMALKKMLELRGAYDLFIMDTAPTGHALRLLETPGIALGWLKSILRLLLKYKSIVRLGSAAEGFMHLLRDVKSVKMALADPRKTEFVAVTIPESLAVLETERLFSGIRRLGISARNIIVNMVIPPTGCHCCRGEQEKYLRQVTAKWEDEYAIASVPLLPRPVRGVEALGEISAL
ncbi:MAG: ArsA family ATPase [Geobacteraceae bacterium]|nr:ArsA family ATPase [Geobacteraceae bacterium]